MTGSVSAERFGPEVDDTPGIPVVVVKVVGEFRLTVIGD